MTGDPVRTGGLLLVHAHPDDETLFTGGTIAHYAARGVPVTVLTCTLGEQGEVIGERYAQLAADQADQLGGYRIAELTAALGALGVNSPRFLGGAGHWRDSGMSGTTADPGLAESAEHPRAFVRSGDEAVQALVDVIDELRPQVVVTYDPRGGYGHPDHIHAHEITMAAVERAAETGWDVPKLYWAILEDPTMKAAGQAMNDRVAAGAVLPAQWIVPPAEALGGFPPEAVSAVIDIADVFEAKVAALRAHATQVTVSEYGLEYALSNNLALPIVAQEAFQLVRGKFAPGPDGREHDLFAGLTGPAE
nr:N-acetyl-1-D-myo-inositol-2-amino-2-deoxy-alpha-D-glucopyranoside deacetylase [Nocardia stercoris]